MPTPRVLTWRRTLRALVLSGRARAASLVAAEPGGPSPAAAATTPASDLTPVPPGPHATTLRRDRSPLDVRGRPRQGRLGDCWVIASMLAVYETAPERLEDLLVAETDGTVRVTLPGAEGPVRVDRDLPVNAAGQFVYARRDGAGPGWVGVLEKAIAGHVAGSYGCLQRGFGRYGLQLLLGMPVRTLLRLPDPATIQMWRDQSRAVLASTHPLSARVRTLQGPLAPNHVYAVIGAEARSGHVLLRNPTRPADLLRIDARTFRRGFLSVDVSPPLR